jgi:hypothetical protein
MTFEEWMKAAWPEQDPGAVKPEGGARLAWQEGTDPRVWREAAFGGEPPVSHCPAGCGYPHTYAIPVDGQHFRCMCGSAYAFPFGTS